MKLFNFFKNKEDNEELKKFKEYQKSVDDGAQRWGCDYEMIPTSDDKNVIEVNKQDFKDLLIKFL